MPSPKSGTRRASKSKSPNRGTRRSPPKNAFEADPILAAMMKGDLLWGDIMYNKPMAPRRRSPTPPYSPINDIFNSYKTPDLRLRKFIWENFPVILEDISTGNGKEKYAIKWHRKNLEEWRSTRTSSFEEAMEYQLFSELRLIHSLRKHSDIYRLHEPRTKDEIVVIEVVGHARPAAAARAPSPPRRGAASAAAAALPVLRKLNDITTFFPGVVVWAKVEGRKGESTYALKIRGDFERKMDPRLAGRILGDLEAALRASRFWAVLPAGGRDEFLRLEMRHD